MKVIDTKIPDVKLLEPQVFGDERGFFMETFRDEWFKQNVADRTFVQENHSKSVKEYYVDYIIKLKIHKVN